MFKIPLADILITGKCNQCCPYCISFYEKGLKKGFLSKRDIKNCAKIFSALKIEAISISGGEPMLAYNLVRASKHLKTNGFKVQIETNCTNFEKYYQDLKGIITWYSFSLDGHTKKINFLMRPQTKKSLNKWGYQFDAVFHALNLLRKNKSKTKVKIGTLVSKQNAESIILIGELIKNYPQIKKWKLYQMRKNNPNHINIKKIKGIIKKIKQKYSKNKSFEIVASPSKYLDQGSILQVRPDTKEIYTEITKDNVFIFGKLGVDSNDKIINNIQKNYRLFKNVNARYNSTYKI